MESMNAIFSGTRPGTGDKPVDTDFRFKRCATRYVEDTDWCKAPDQNKVDKSERAGNGNIDRVRRIANRIGGTGTLNMYLKPLNLGRPKGTGGLNGIATFPFYLPGPNQVSLPWSNYELGNDGISIDGSRLPGTTNNNVLTTDTTPSTTPHEAGHWLAVFHT